MNHQAWLTQFYLFNNALIQILIVVMFKYCTQRLYFQLKKKVVKWVTLCYNIVILLYYSKYRVDLGHRKNITRKITTRSNFNFNTLTFSEKLSNK